MAKAKKTAGRNEGVPPEAAPSVYDRVIEVLGSPRSEADEGPLTSEEIADRLTGDWTPAELTGALQYGCASGAIRAHDPGDCDEPILYSLATAATPHAGGGRRAPGRAVPGGAVSRGTLTAEAVAERIAEARRGYDAAHDEPVGSDDAETFAQFRGRMNAWSKARDVAIARGVLALVEDAGALSAGDGAAFRVCVAALVTDPRGRVALVQGKRGGLELPGGKVRPGEPWIEAIAREVFEETALIPSFDDRPLWVLHAGIADGLTCESTVIVYRGTVSIEHPLTPGGDATDARWYAPDDLPGLANLPSARRLREWAAGQTERPALSRAEVRPDHDARAAGARAVIETLLLPGAASTSAEAAQWIAQRLDFRLPGGPCSSEHLVGAANRLREIASELVGLAAERGPA